MITEDKGTFKLDDFDFEKTAIEKNGYKQSDEKKNTKVSLSMTVEDYLDLIAFKNHKVLKLKNLEYTISSAIVYGLSLLESKYKIERDREKVTLKRGRRTGEKVELKDTTIDLPEERANFINDFLYYKVFDKGFIEYTRPEMMGELVKLIKSKNKEIFTS